LRGRSTWGLSALQGNYTATFVVPGVKLKLVPEFPASPYFFAGVGVAHFSANGTLSGSVVDKSNTTTAVDFGGGLDIKVLPFFSIRGELRNVNSGGLGFALPIETGRQNNIMATGGLVFRF
jgi:opacity protein-like surface antigen